MSSQGKNRLPELKDWIHQIEFLTSASRAADLPPIGSGEVAIAGRSNAGKSSALNLICNRRRLAFFSKTPGRTQLINVFHLSWQGQELGRLVDLPGYGYAAVDRATKARWQQELARFIESRLSLVALIVVMDIRHAFGPLDQQMLDWFGVRQQPIHVLLTKSDKLGKNEQSRALANARKMIDTHSARWGGQVSVSLFSATARVGRDEVLAKLEQWWELDKKNPTEDPSGSNA